MNYLLAGAGFLPSTVLEECIALTVSVFAAFTWNCRCLTPHFLPSSYKKRKLVCPLDSIDSEYPFFSLAS